MLYILWKRNKPTAPLLYFQNCSKSTNLDSFRVININVLKLSTFILAPVDKLYRQVKFIITCIYGSAL